MQKYLSYAVSLVLFTVGACTPSTNETASSSKSADPSYSSDKAKNTDSKPQTSATNGWQDYSSESGKFSVQMPTGSIVQTMLDQYLNANKLEIAT